MKNPFVPRRRKGKRLPLVETRRYPSGHHARHEQRDGVKTNTAVVTEDLARTWELSPVRETVETHLVPRKSLSTDQLLGIKSPTFEEVAMLGERHLVNAQTGELSPIVYNPKWKPVTPRSLLNQGKPGARSPYLVRTTSRTKRRKNFPDAEQPDSGIDSVTVVGGSELDDLILQHETENPEPLTPEAFERCKVCERVKIIGKVCTFHPTITAS